MTTYDVLLSHSTADTTDVEAISVRLQAEANLRPFLDEWHLVPGEDWVSGLARALEESTSVAVFFGPQGMSAWHDRETKLALILGADGPTRRVIPILLPGARKEYVTNFLRLRTWVDLTEERGFEQLVAGISGKTGADGSTRLDTFKGFCTAPWRAI